MFNSCVLWVVKKKMPIWFLYVALTYWVTSTHGGSCSFWQLCCQSPIFSSHSLQSKATEGIIPSHRLIPLPLLTPSLSAPPQVMDRLLELQKKAANRSKVTEWNNPFIKHSSPAEVKLALGRSACMLCPSSASDKACTILFTFLPWEAHSWLITSQLAVQHDCSWEEKPVKCLNGVLWECLAFVSLCLEFLFILYLLFLSLYDTFI